MSWEFFALVFINVVAVGAVGYYVATRLKPAGPDKDAEDAQRQQMKNLINEVYGEVTTKVTEQSKQVLRGEQEMIAADLKSKHSEIEKVITELRRELTDRQRDIRALEQTREKQFSEVATQIREHQKITEKLSDNTNKLSAMMTNNQQRGQWGEYILENILRTAGLIEGVHYAKQQSYSSNAVRPDITLLLPNQRRVPIDVKFPYAAVLKMSDAETPEQKLAAKKLFVTDVKAKLKQITSREYISATENTLDYAILFVPNEMVFSFINQHAPEVIDLAMQQKVMIVSPFTFLIVARTVMESYRNFMIENHLRDIIVYIGDFVEEWGRFEGEFGKFDEQLVRMRKAFDQIAQTRFNRMKLRIGRIEEFRHGMLESGSPADLPKESAVPSVAVPLLVDE